MILAKNIFTSKLDVTFKDAVEMFQDEIKTLKEYIFIKRSQGNAYHEIKVSLSENNFVLHADVAESYKNDQQTRFHTNSTFSILAY